MSNSRWGKKWADVEEDDDEGLIQSPTSKGRFETKPDAQGFKTVIDYSERDGKTWKICKKLKQTTVIKWTNEAMTARKSMSKFGKATGSDEAGKIVRSEEEIPIELTKKTGVSLTTKDDAEDKFFEESLSITESLCKEKKVWTDINRERQLARDGPDVTAEKPVDATATGGDAPTLAAGQAGRYVPPSLRSGGGAPGKAGGKGAGTDGQMEASVRITNLSEDVRDGDLQDLFGQFGRLQRVYLAKDQTTGASKGFAFVTYYNKDDAQLAINKLNGHGYDNLILQVQWAKPRA